ncbi:MAG: 3-phosphoshikimate 1-carboxyvinyltransferase [Spirochaetaceae bacterium]|jgi:3-phosphoshikimate 1-carboxyvinyltransferase|nr:3-phosphoshikimate 1-carboxyvinyltransferase [Spirochaetaceae bacterium]
MDKTILPHRFSGTVRVPASKSHTIRALLLAAAAEGVSRLEYPLDSLDTRSCMAACRAFGANIEEVAAADGVLRGLVVTGNPPEKWDGAAKTIDVGNSGTTLFFGLAFAALGHGAVTFTGDDQIANRSAAPLLDALSALGAEVVSRNGCAPITVRGPLCGGRVVLPCPTSQYLSALLLALPLCPAGVTAEINIPLLNELPYIKMTLAYLRKYLADGRMNGASGSSGIAGVTLPATGQGQWAVPATIAIRGGNCYRAFNAGVTGDFSSAAFPACAGAVSGGEVQLEGLDFDDEQGDKVFFDLLAKAGKGAPLAPLGVVDLNAMPDLLPIAAVLACYGAGESRLVNVAHARIKETDRIAVMCEELSKLGADIAELPDGLVIRGGKKLRGGHVDGRRDHRIVMALAVAALGADGPVTIAGAEAADVTYPGFLHLLQPTCRGGEAGAA